MKAIKQTTIYRLMLMAVCVAGMHSCNDPYKDQEFKPYDEIPIGLWLQDQPEYSLWVEMLQAADLFNALNVGVTDMTCFVADNNAVEAYMRDVAGCSSYKDMNPEELEYLMRYHIVPGGKVLSSNLMLRLPFPTASGDYLTAGLDIESDSRYIDNGEGREISFIIRKDFEMSNGIVHSLDKMLQPITETVWDVISSNDRYSIFSQALAAAGLDDWLSNVEVEVLKTTVREYKTVFAVSDSVYNQFAVHSLSDLRDMFPGDPKDTESRFHQYMLYHIIDKLKGYADLTVFPSGYNSMIIYTCSTLKGLSVLDEGGQIWFNPNEENFRILDSRRDIPARNGYIHEVDNIMALPAAMPHYPVMWEPTDKLVFTAIPFYRSDKAKDDPVNKHYFEPGGGIPGIRWESIPDTRAQVWYHSEYMGDNGRYLHNDALYWDMGDIGWLEMDLPILPAGSYEMFVEKSNHDNGGRASVLWNGRDANTNANFVNGSNWATWSTQNLAGEMPQVVKFTSLQSGWLGIDRFMFVPR